MSKKEELNIFLCKDDILVLHDEDYLKFYIVENDDCINIIPGNIPLANQVYPKSLYENLNEQVEFYNKLTSKMTNEEIVDVFLSYFENYDIEKYKERISFVNQNVSIYLTFDQKELMFKEYYFGEPISTIDQILQSVSSSAHQEIFKDLCFETKMKYPELFHSLQQFKKFWYAANKEKRVKYLNKIFSK